MLEQGFSSLYNPKLLEASQRLNYRQGMQENFIRRDKTTHTYIFYEQIEKKRVNSELKVTPKT